MTHMLMCLIFISSLQLYLLRLHLAMMVLFLFTYPMFSVTIFHVLTYKFADDILNIRRALHACFYNRRYGCSACFRALENDIFLSIVDTSEPADCVTDY